MIFDRNGVTRTHSLPRKLAGLQLLLLTIVISVLTGCATTVQGSASPTPTPDPTSVPSGTVLFQSDWNKGLSSWAGSAGWSVGQGIVRSDLGTKDPLVIPYTPATPNYAIEVRFEVENVPHSGGYLVVSSTKAGNRPGFSAGLLNLLDSRPHNQFINDQVQVTLDPTDAMDAPLQVSDYQPCTSWCVYRVEVRGTHVRLAINGTIKSSTNSLKGDVSNQPLEIVSSLAEISISSVRVVTL